MKLINLSVYNNKLKTKKQKLNKMKKIFLTLMIMVSTMVSISASTVKVDSTTTQTGMSIQDTGVYNDGKRALQGIVVGTKELASNGYDIVVQQQRMYAFQYLLVGVLCLICSFLFVRFYRKATGTEKVANMLVPAVIFGIVAVWTAIVFSMHYTQVMQGLINPDYAAIQDIISMFKK